MILKWNKIKISIKNAYTLLLAPGNGCTFNQFRTYGYLVKLGFRVFKHDSKLRNDNYDQKNLTKLPEISSKKKKYSTNNFRLNNKTEVSYCNKNTVPFPKLESSGWVVISRQPSIYLPSNLQPNYDVYSFNITIKSNTTVITEMIAFNETTDVKKVQFHPRESKVYESPLSTVIYPVYEKNIPKIIKSNYENIYEPQAKRFKQTKIEDDLLIVSMTATSTVNKNNIQVSNTNLINKECNHPMNIIDNNEDGEKVGLLMNIKKKITSYDEDRSMNSLNRINLIEKVHDDFYNEENMIIEEDNVSITMIEAASTSNDKFSNIVSKNEINSTNKIHGNLNNEGTIADSIPFVNSTNYSEKSHEDHKFSTCNIISEDTAFEAQLNLPSNNIKF